MTFRTVAKTIAHRNGLAADFSPKPLNDQPGNGFHINISVKARDGSDQMSSMIAGILEHIREMTLFLNPAENSYRRLGKCKAPEYISWSSQNRSQLIRIPAAEGEYRRAELRSPDPWANPYLAFALIIRAGLDGIKDHRPLMSPVNENLYQADSSRLYSLGLQRLPADLEQAREAAGSAFISDHIPSAIREAYCCR